MTSTSMSATADWVLIFRYSDADVYADSSTVSRDKDKSPMWNEIDSKKAGTF